MTLAFSSKHPFVPNPKKDPDATRWIASLSDGTTVFEDVTPNTPTAWRRLSVYVELHGHKLTNLRLEAYGRSIVLVPYKSSDGIAQINGYWQSHKVSTFLNASGTVSRYSCGIGYVKGKEVVITWVDHVGNVSQEIRPYQLDNPAIILNDAV